MVAGRIPSAASPAAAAAVRFCPSSVSGRSASGDPSAAIPCRISTTTSLESSIFVRNRTRRGRLPQPGGGRGVKAAASRTRGRTTRARSGRSAGQPPQQSGESGLVDSAFRHEWLILRTGAANACIVDAPGQNAYVGVFESLNQSTIHVVPLDGSPAYPIASIPAGVSGLAIDPRDGSLYASCLGGPPNLFKIHPVWGAVTPIAINPNPSRFGSLEAGPSVTVRFDLPWTGAATGVDGLPLAGNTSFGVSLSTSPPDRPLSGLIGLSLARAATPIPVGSGSIVTEPAALIAAIPVNAIGHFALPIPLPPGITGIEACFQVSSSTARASPSPRASTSTPSEPGHPRSGPRTDDDESQTQGVGPADMLRHLVGEDPSVGCVLSWGPCWYTQKAFFDGKVHTLSTKNHILRRHGRERVHRGRRPPRGGLHLRGGHALALGADHLIPHAPLRIPEPDQRRSGLPMHITADGSLSTLWDIGIEGSCWVALRILPSCHTNPVFVLVEDRPIRDSKQSAAWSLEAADQCWSQEERRIRPAEESATRAAYAAARAACRRVLSGSGP